MKYLILCGILIVVLVFCIKSSYKITIALASVVTVSLLLFICRDNISKFLEVVL